MPRVTPVASKADVAPEHQAVVDDVLKVALPGIEWVILEGEHGKELVDSGFSGF